MNKPAYGEVLEMARRLNERLTDEEWAAHDERIRQERARVDVEDRAQAERERAVWLVDDVCIPAKDIDRIESGSLGETKAMRAMRETLEKGYRIVVLSGTRGSGKTTAAAWWSVQRQPQHRYLPTQQPFFVDASRLARWPRYDEGKMQRLESALALVIDDLGVEYDDKQGNFRSMFDALVNARYASMLPTVITTNLNAEEFKARYGERVADRIREVGRFVSIPDESLRGGR